MASGRRARAEPTRSRFDLSSHLEAGGGGDRRRGPAMHRADDLAAVDALQVAGDPKVGVPKLKLDHDQRNALVRHLDSMSMPQLVWCEPPSHTRSGGGMVQLLACRRRLPAATSGRSADHTQHGADWELATDVKPRFELLPRPTIH